MHGDAVFLCAMKPRNLGTTTKGKTMIPEVFFSFIMDFQALISVFPKKLHQIMVKKYFIMQIYPWDMLGFPIICLVFIVLNWTISKREQNPYIS